MIEYPPYIEGILPAFASNVRIPFQMNPAVSSAMVKYFVVRFMDLNANVIKHEYVQANSTMFTNKAISFTCSISTNIMPTKNYYKVQVAYSDMTLSQTQTNVNNLAYSTVGVIKRTTGLSSGGQWIDFGAYENNLKYNSFKLKITMTDLNEPIYSYRFYIKQQSNGAMFYDTGYQLHNTELDTFNTGMTERYSELQCIMNKIYKSNVVYKAYCAIRTVNNYAYTFSSAAFVGVNGSTSEGDTNYLTYLQTDQDKEEGRVALQLSIKTTTLGNYMIKRTSSLDNYTTWDNVYSIAKTSQATLNKTIYDYSIMQGVFYKYYLIQYDSKGNFISEKIGQPTTALLADFEYIYLGDKDKQFKIKYDGNISSIKNTIQEQKVDTIGSQFPFFYRNGNVKYKELSISGLISYLADDEQLFLSRSSLGLNSTTRQPTIQLVDYNYGAERKFKMEVLEWLNNGKPKLLRTPGEGNFIVRLMNANLSPKQGVSNLLHSFSATAYEIREYNYANLKECELVK